MKRKILIVFLSLLLGLTTGSVQGADLSSLQERAEAENGKGHVANARSLFIRAFEDYVGKGQMTQGVECGVKATALYYNENLYKEAFDLLRRIDQNIEANGKGQNKAALHYQTSKVRYQMYMKMRRAASAQEQIAHMEQYAASSGDEGIKNDLLYCKTICYYSFGQNEKGNATFKEMTSRLTASKEYGKVDEVYQTLIANGRKSGSATLVAESYKSYVAWKDSASAQKLKDETDALKGQIAQLEATIAEKDGGLKTRQAVIVGLGILSAVLAAILVLGGFVLMRFIFLTRKQKKTIRIADENNALKAKFISNISAQLEPTLQKLDSRLPEVKALQDFSAHIQTLSDLENSGDGDVEREDVQVDALCENVMNEIRSKVKSGVTLTVDAPKMSASINRAYVSHILLHLLNNAAIYTPEGGQITLEYKKRGAHKHQFVVTDTGCGIPAEKQEDIFKPFLEIRDLTTGDGLGLPICKRMAQKMGGDIEVVSTYVKGARFTLNLLG